MAKTKTPQQVAEEQLQREETARREHRVAELAGQEEARRTQEQRVAELWKDRAAALEEVDKHVGQRQEVQEKLQEQLEAFKGSIEELHEVDRNHRRALSKAAELSRELSRAGATGEARVDKAASENVPAYVLQSPVRDTPRPWIKEELAGVFGTYGNPGEPPGTLAQRDRLTTVVPGLPPDSGRKPPAGLKGASLEDMRRSDEAAAERATEQRRQRMRQEYGREPLPHEYDSHASRHPLRSDARDE